MKKDRSRYKKIDPRMWIDPVFCALSAPKPNAQTLWIYLLTGPCSRVFPGLLQITSLGLAGGLHWPQSAVKKCLLELEKAKPKTSKMLTCDEINGVIFIPNCFKYNPPVSPNQAMSWAMDLHEMPEVSLVFSAVKAAYDFLLGLDHAFVLAFLQGLPLALRQGLPQGIPTTLPHSRARARAREKEKEKEQEPFASDDSAASLSPPDGGSAASSPFAHSDSINGVVGDCAKCNAKNVRLGLIYEQENEKPIKVCDNCVQLILANRQKAKVNDLAKGIIRKI